MQKTHITILSLNTWHGTLLDDISDYVTSVIDDVDVFCFQEADGPIDTVLDNILLSQFEGRYTIKQADGDYFRLATYVRRGIPIVSTKSLLMDAPGTGAAFACTINLSTDTTLTITNVHGQPQPGHKADTPARLQQTEEIITYTNKQPGLHVVVGDFNLQPDSQSVTLFSDNNYKDLVKEFAIPTTRNEEAWRQYSDNKQLFADYAFIRGDKILDYSFTVEDIIISDHLPLIVSLSIATQHSNTTSTHADTREASLSTRAN